MSATQAATSAGGRRVGVQVPLVQPHRADVHRVARRRGDPSPSPRISSVEPPPMSTTSTGPARRLAQVAHRAVEGQRRLLVAGDHLGLDAEPGAHAGAKTVGVARRRGWPRWRRSGPGRRRGRRSARRTRRWRRRRAPAPRRRAGRCGRRPGRAAPSAISRTGDVGQVADQQLDGVGAAVDGGDRSAHRSTAATHGPAAHHAPEQLEHLVAERVDARALGQGLAGQHVQALDPVGHAAGGDAVDLGHARPSSAPRRRGSARGRRGRPRPARGPRRAAPASPSSGPSPRGCRSARRRAGRSGSRSSGTACRRAAAARW